MDAKGPSKVSPPILPMYSSVCMHQNLSLLTHSPRRTLAVEGADPVVAGAPVSALLFIPGLTSPPQVQLKPWTRGLEPGPGYSRRLGRRKMLIRGGWEGLARIKGRCGPALGVPCTVTVVRVFKARVAADPGLHALQGLQNLIPLLGGSIRAFLVQALGLPDKQTRSGPGQRRDTRFKPPGKHQNVHRQERKGVLEHGDSHSG
ncbi:hypothetical protein EGW08_000555 [Elysia chlorotica]|uniref:Uncharacterized protein n=1 Tax=Elysia chlorotica TaxID=188477 RepID=A0A3S1BU87_ELYCH|nr:hypothetical protein EGW08_000555 [Elysia chlorotica]